MQGTRIVDSELKIDHRVGAEKEIWTLCALRLAPGDLVSTVLWILAVLVLGGIYVPVIAELMHVWRTNTYAIHGMFVPFFSALILWNERAGLREASGQGSPAGLLVILLGLGVLALGKWAESLIIQGLSVPVCVAGIVLWGFGGRLLKAAVFPITFLIFMAPPPALLITSVTLHLQLFAAAFAGSSLRLLDVPFYQSGVLIELPTMTLKIAEICNGLRFMFALLVLAIAFAQVTQRTLTHKIVLVLSAIPFAILANWVRVAVIVVGVHYVGPQIASGFIHHTIGKGVWVLTLVPLVALGLSLRRSASSTE